MIELEALYDPANPVWEKREYKEECPDCKGEGKFNISDCCGATPSGNGDCDTSDIGICSDCGEHCAYGVVCDTCKGTGEIYVEAEYDDDNKYQSLKEDEI